MCHYGRPPLPPLLAYHQVKPVVLFFQHQIQDWIVFLLIIASEAFFKPLADDYERGDVVQLLVHTK
jgi:hypothetical protein